MKTIAQKIVDDSNWDLVQVSDLCCDLTLEPPEDLDDGSRTFVFEDQSSIILQEVDGKTDIKVVGED